MVTSLDYELAFFGEVYSKGEAITDTWAICRARVGRGERWERYVSTFRQRVSSSPFAWLPITCKEVSPRRAEGTGEGVTS